MRTARVDQVRASSFLAPSEECEQARLTTSELRHAGAFANDGVALVITRAPPGTRACAAYHGRNDVAAPNVKLGGGCAPHMEHIGARRRPDALSSSLRVSVASPWRHGDTGQKNMLSIAVARGEMVGRAILGARHLIDGIFGSADVGQRTRKHAHARAPPEERATRSGRTGPWMAGGGQPVVPDGRSARSSDRCGRGAEHGHRAFGGARTWATRPDGVGGGGGARAGATLHRRSATGPRRLARGGRAGPGIAPGAGRAGRAAAEMRRSRRRCAPRACGVRASWVENRPATARRRRTRRRWGGSRRRRDEPKRRITHAGINWADPRLAKCKAFGV